MRLWSAKAKFSAFRLLAGQADQVDYQFASGLAHHLFCKYCGIRAYEWVDTPNMTGEKYLNVNVACLDGVNIDELMAAPVTYYDGRNDNWHSAPDERRHL